MEVSRSTFFRGTWTNNHGNCYTSFLSFLPGQTLSENFHETRGGGGIRVFVPLGSPISAVGSSTGKGQSKQGQELYWT